MSITDINKQLNNLSITNKNQNKYKVIDLFAGTGAFSYSFEKHLYFECIFANDMIDESQSIYDLNHKIKLTKKDFNDIKPNEIPSHDILCGGFPCQPFSIAGNQKGFDDERSNVFWNILNILKIHKPQIVILENVKNLKSHDNGKTFNIILENLKLIGYYIKWKILNTSKITKIPQNRERIYIVCFLDKQYYDKFDLDFPIVINIPIINLLEKKILDKYYYTKKIKNYNEYEKNITKNINENVLYQYRRVYFRENKSGVCPTLTANMGTGGNNIPILLDNKGIRKLTPKECFNLQGFPIYYKLPPISDSKLYKLAGNAVSMPVVDLIVKKIVNLLD